VEARATPVLPEEGALTPPRVSGDQSQGLDSAQELAENAAARTQLQALVQQAQVNAELVAEAIRENRLREERIAQAQAEEDAAVAAAIIAMLLDDDA
jgi:hypothetical protein